MATRPRRPHQRRKAWERQASLDSHGQPGSAGPHRRGAGGSVHRAPPRTERVPHLQIVTCGSERAGKRPGLPGGRGQTQKPMCFHGIQGQRVTWGRGHSGHKAPTLSGAHPAAYTRSQRSSSPEKRGQGWRGAKTSRPSWPNAPASQQAA